MLINTIFNTFISSPLYYIGCIFAVVATLAFLQYLRGFIAGVGHIFDDGQHIEHQGHADERAVHGVVMLIALFVVWETIRLTAAIFSGGASLSLGLGVFLAVVWATLIWWLFFATPAKGGGGH